jgi:SNF2-related domain
MIKHLDISNPADYDLFLKIKSLPSYKFQGRTAIIPDEYAHILESDAQPVTHRKYVPLKSLFDYQSDISSLAILKKKFALFMECGSGKSLCILEFARYVQSLVSPQKRVLIVTPLMVAPQFLSETKKFYTDAGYNDFTVEHVRADRLKTWTTEIGSSVGITNYEALKDNVPQGRLACLILDESSMLKSEYGKYANQCIRLGKGLEWKLCATGTPAPNDRVEFANHAIFLDVFQSTNAFLSRYFINKGKTGEKWELKKHAVEAFYKDLSHWSIFLQNPGVYGWKDNCEKIPPIKINIHDVELTEEQNDAALSGTGMLFAIHTGGITKRTKASQIAKGLHKGKKISTNKYTYIKSLVDSWPSESTIIWCLYNHEQSELEKVFPRAASIQGKTSYYQRLVLLNDFQSGRRPVLISKAKVLGLGLNLQVATRHVFSSCVDSYESFWQAMKRSNRYGSIEALNVHVPVTELEIPMMETVMKKWDRVKHDNDICERLFSRYTLQGLLHLKSA